MPQQIDLRLFAHILLDPELHGRYDLQGIDFVTTTTYLIEYLNEYILQYADEVTSKLSRLKTKLELLIELDIATQIVNGEPLSDLYSDNRLLSALTNEPASHLLIGHA